MTVPKILFVITKSNWGGAQRQVYELATHFRDQKYDVTVALGGKGLLYEKLTADGIPTISIDTMARDMALTKEFRSFLKIFRIVGKVKPDILHVHSPKAAGLASLAGRLRGVKKIIYTVHGFAFNEDRPEWHKVLIAFFSWITCVLATRIITISLREYNQAIQFPFTQKKTLLIRNGLSAEALYSHTNARKQLETIARVSLDKKICIGTIGELHPNKGQWYLLQAMKELIPKYPKLHLIIIGEGEERARFESYIQENQLGQHISLVGFVPDAALNTKGFDIFVFPSLKEGLPYALLEAGNAGLPVIATCVGGIPEIIDDMKSGILIQPKRTREIIHSIELMLENPDKQKNYAQNLKQKILTDFSKEKMFSSIEKLYLE